MIFQHHAITDLSAHNVCTFWLLSSFPGEFELVSLIAQTSTHTSKVMLKVGLV